MPPATSDSRSLNRLMDILNSFTEAEPVLSLTEISRRIHLPKSTTFRFLEAMAGQGLLVADPVGRGYRLGYQLIRWGTLAQASIQLRDDALPFLRALAEQTGETAILSVRFGSNATWVELVESRHPVRLAMRVGQSLQLHAGASSKVLWAFLPVEEREAIFRVIQFTPLEKNTITAPEAMRAELEEIRRRGYATSFEETDAGAMGVAAPVYDHSGRLVSGIGIAGPVARVTENRVPAIAIQVLEAARQLSHRLGMP